MIPDDCFFMREALKEAELAASAGEVPIGAVAVKDGEIIARSRNKVEEKHTVSAHAEFEVLRQIEKEINDWRMTGYTLYVTKEPCLMCTGMLINARFSRIVFGLRDPAGGGCGGAVDLPDLPGVLWHPEVTGGVLEAESAALIKAFFSHVRSREKKKKGKDQMDLVILGGGVSGLAMVLRELLGFGSVGLIQIIINVPLFLLGGIKIGKKFFWGSLLGMFASSLFIDLFAPIPVPQTDAVAIH